MAYAAYCWTVFLALGLSTWVSVLALPTHSARWSALRACSRALGKLTATRVTIHGTDNLPAEGSHCVLVSNHSSYIDSFVLAAVIPRTFRFVAKAELADSILLRKPLNNIHTEFVERFDTGKSVSDSQYLAEVLQQGNALLYFAEGTFTRIPGLAPFHLGAFSVAAETGAAVVPIAIRGTRSILRPESWFPRRGSIHVEIGQPISPGELESEAGSDNWTTALALRDRCREFILRHCGEPDLA